MWKRPQWTNYITWLYGWYNTNLWIHLMPLNPFDHKHQCRLKKKTSTYWSHQTYTSYLPCITYSCLVLSWSHIYKLSLSCSKQVKIICAHLYLWLPAQDTLYNTSHYEEVVIKIALSVAQMPWWLVKKKLKQSNKNIKN